MKILNLTQHVATPEQVEAGVVEPTDKAEVQRLLTFDTLPDNVTLIDRAKALTAIAVKEQAQAVMLGGAPFFMMPLQEELHAQGIRTLFAFSVRDVVETLKTDGTCTKETVFWHRGFVEP